MFEVHAKNASLRYLDYVKREKAAKQEDGVGYRVGEGFKVHFSGVAEMSMCIVG